MDFENVYEDAQRADAYATLEFPGTYYLAYRDIPEILRRHARGTMALDFGCGAGRSTRFLKQCGFDAMGVDISEEMVNKARERDPAGTYHVIHPGDLSLIQNRSCDVILSAFTFDNIPTYEQKLANFQEIRRVLSAHGRFVNLVSSPEIYTHEWASFTTKEFPENAFAKSGDLVKIIMTDVADARPVEDVLWTDEAYRELYQAADLDALEVSRPLGRADEPYRWISETRVAPWVIYILQ